MDRVMRTFGMARGHKRAPSTACSIDRASSVPPAVLGFGLAIVKHIAGNYNRDIKSGRTPGTGPPSIPEHVEGPP